MASMKKLRTTPRERERQQGAEPARLLVLLTLAADDLPATIRALSVGRKYCDASHSGRSDKTHTSGGPIRRCRLSYRAATMSTSTFAGVAT
jgi:hypothetical protein